MPTLRDIQERTIQQVRSLASRSVSFVNESITAFNDFIVGKNRGNNSENWSASTSERNIPGCDSSKKKFKYIVLE